MKKIFTLLLSTIFSLSLFAYDGSRLSISSPGVSSELKIEIDGRPFSMKNNEITLSYLNEGFHQVKIYRDSKRSDDFRRRQDIIFNGAVCLKKGYHTDITVNRFGKVMTDEHLIDVNDEYYEDQDDYNNSEDGGWSATNPDVMTGREFETLKDQLRREWSEPNRMTSMCTIIDKSEFTTRQVKDLMLLFTFESNRLEVAKSAYRKTVDKENYSQLNDVLTFSSSKDDLARFIRESR